MKVYIVVATYGEFEDAMDEVVKAFTNKEKAETCLKENEEKRLKDMERDDLYYWQIPEYLRIEEIEVEE